MAQGRFERVSGGSWTRGMLLNLVVVVYGLNVFAATGFVDKL